MPGEAPHSFLKGGCLKQRPREYGWHGSSVVSWATRESQENLPKIEGSEASCHPYFDDLSMGQTASLSPKEEKIRRGKYVYMELLQRHRGISSGCGGGEP